MTRELAVTLPLDVAESLLRSAQRLGRQYLKADDREALEIAEREIEAVKAAGEPPEMVTIKPHPLSK